jgi:glucose/arabinose dehydrogenase
MKRAVVIASMVLVAAVACSDDDSGPNEPPAGAEPPTSASPTASDEPTETATAPTVSEQPSDLSPEVVARNLEVPWGIDFLPDGSALIAERANGTIQRLDPGGRVSQVGSVPGVAPTAEGGLLGVAVSPSFRDDRSIYAYLTTDQDNRVVRMSLTGNRLSDPEPIITGIPAGAVHDGGRIKFGPDGMLYVTTGEAGDEQLAQDPESLGGKILRIEPDGDVPSDNPDPQSPVWTMGHRNVQGLAWDDQERLWATEFGAQAWDELNLIEPGNNYGWPDAEGRSDLEEYTNPVRQWSTDKASPSGVAYLDGSLWIASLQGERLWQVPIRPNGSAGQPEAHYTGEYGRLRTVVTTPDDVMWFTTSNRDGRGDPAPADDRIFWIRP